MICSECRYEADRVKYEGKTHAYFRSINNQWKEFGADHAPIGHAACTGCDCAHKDVGFSDHE